MFMLLWPWLAVVVVVVLLGGVIMLAQRGRP
jgi:hypothetical protein